MEERAPAKVNLFLEVLGKRPDGFHEIVTVMQELELSDQLEAEADDRLSLTSSGLGIPPGGENLVLKAARLLAEEAGVRKGARFALEKRIPAGAGLGGGSSDAAAALRLCDRLWGLQASREDLAGVAARVGSDVPFFLEGGTALATGRGEKLESLDPLPFFPLQVAWPCVALSTRSVYEALRIPQEPRTADVFLKALETNDLRLISMAMFNRLEAPALQVCPSLSEAPSGFLMSGSGSSFFHLGEEPVGAIPRGWKVFRTSTPA